MDVRIRNRATRPSEPGIFCEPRSAEGMEEALERERSARKDAEQRVAHLEARLHAVKGSVLPAPPYGSEKDIFAKRSNSIPVDTK